MQDPVDKLQAQGFFRIEDSAGIGGPNQSGLRKLPGGSDICDDALPDIAEQQLFLFTGGLAHAVAQKGFDGGFILTDFRDLDADAETLEGFAIIRVKRGQTLEFDFAGRVDINLISNTGHVEFALRAVFNPREDGLPRFFEFHNGLA